VDATPKQAPAKDSQPAAAPAPVEETATEETAEEKPAEKKTAARAKKK
jgi:hypothetical protein